MMWPKPPYHDPEQEVGSNALGVQAIALLTSAGRYRFTDEWGGTDCAVQATRIICYPFYPGACSVEIAIDLPFDEGLGIGAWLVRVESSSSISNGSVTDEVSRAVSAGNAGTIHSDLVITKLNGTSPPIHEFNDACPVDVTSPELAVSYLKFFCAHVWGEDGGFWICSGRDDIPFKSDDDQERRAPELSQISPPSFQLQDDQGRWIFTATILYAGALFEARLAVRSNGMVEMLSDEPWATDVPVIVEARRDGLRCIDDPAFRIRSARRSPE